MLGRKSFNLETGSAGWKELKTLLLQTHLNLQFYVFSPQYIYLMFKDDSQTSSPSTLHNLTHDFIKAVNVCHF